MADAGHVRLRGALVARRNPDGGYGARPGLPSTTEPTAVATLALAAGGEAGDAATPRAWLRSAELPGGGWPSAAGAPEASWATALAVLALARFPDAAAPTARGVAWLVAARGSVLKTRRGLAAWLLGGPRIVDLDPDLVGWPWLAETFTWVEPTAYAMLALDAGAPDDPAARARVEEGRRVLLDRICPDGGWNYGNLRVLGEDLWSYPDTTALALLALGPRAGDEVAGRASDALETMLRSNPSGLATALGILALAPRGRDVGALRARLYARFDETQFLGDARAHAWAVLATADGAAPFGGGGRA